ncbi:MAG: hypothetical protein IT435_11615 [Phycisphaerales bacterium]|nr:hypothetical protein [Phycisphaerales bacterium]
MKLATVPPATLSHQPAIGIYERATTRTREQSLAKNALGINLAMELKPTRQRAVELTEMAWIRDDHPASDIAAAKHTLPWVIHGTRNWRDVAAFMVNHAPGSVFAARAAVDGPVIRVYNRYGMASWVYAIGLLSWWIAGPVVAAFLLIKGLPNLAIPLLLISVGIGAIGARQVLSLIGVLPLSTPGTAINFGDEAFEARWSVSCRNANHARWMLTPEVRAKIMKNSPAGTAWWSIGNGWVSCVSSVEPVNRTHGRILRQDALADAIDTAADLARSLERYRAGTSASTSSGCTTM